MTAATPVPLRYVGKKASGETDHLYGTGITWDKPGDVKDVPADKAPLLLNHPDVWRDARVSAAKKTDPIEPKEPESKRIHEEEIIPDVAAKVHLMDKTGLVAYALTQFGERLDLDGKGTVESVRTEVVRLINTRG